MSTSKLFKQGRRIRFDISSSNFPRFDIKPPTGEPEDRASRGQKAVNSVHLSRLHPP